MILNILATIFALLFYLVFINMPRIADTVGMLIYCTSWIGLAILIIGIWS